VCVCASRGLPTLNVAQHGSIVTAFVVWNVLLWQLVSRLMISFEMPTWCLWVSTIVSMCSVFLPSAFYPPLLDAARLATTDWWIRLQLYAGCSSISAHLAVTRTRYAAHVLLFLSFTSNCVIFIFVFIFWNGIILLLFIIFKINLSNILGYWCLRADERLGNPPPR